MKQWAHKQSGFTIVELLIVIVVIAILAAITIVSYNGITGRAQESGTASHLKDLIKKVELFKVENGSYPPSIASITGAKDDDVYSLAWNTYCVASGTSAKQYYMMSDTQKVNKGSCDVRIKPSLPFAPEACFGFDSAIQSITFWYAYENNNSANAKCPTEFSVPSQIGGVPVQHIGRGSGPGFSNAQVDAVVLPETLVSIYGAAFERSSIKYVYLPDSMTTMCCGGFGGTSLSSIFIPDSLAALQPVVYSGQSLESAVFGSPGYTGASKNKLEFPVISNSPNVKTITINRVVKSIESGAFVNLAGLTTLTLNPGVEKISYGAFSNLPSLKSVTIPATVTDISYQAFSGTGLESITFAPGMTSIGVGAIADNPKLTTVTIPNTVTSIGESAFTRNNITSVTIPSSVATIGPNAFTGNPGIVCRIPAGKTFTNIGCASTVYY